MEGGLRGQLDERTGIDEFHGGAVAIELGHEDTLKVVVLATDDKVQS